MQVNSISEKDILSVNLCYSGFFSNCFIILSSLIDYFNNNNIKHLIKLTLVKRL
jgi:hypothetical protein